MNDFTKDELNIIYLDMTIYAKRNTPPLKESPSHLDLRNKIQSMIDNYCDHKGAIPGIRQYTSFECVKCGRSPV